MEEINKNKLGAKKIILIILTILIVGPLVFVGACFPIGLFGYGVDSGEGGTIILYIAFIIGLALSIFIVYLIIRKIARK